jgi:hypothetical protein
MLHVVQLHHDLQPTIADKRVSIVVVTFAESSDLSLWQERVLFAEAPSADFANTAFLSDPSLTIYHTYGLGRNSFLRVYGVRILWHYAKLYLRGKPLPRVKQDTLQRGGDFVIGRDGRIALAHVGRDQSDRVNSRDIIKALEKEF